MQTVDRKNCVRRLSFTDTAKHNHRSSRHWQEKRPWPDVFGSTNIAKIWLLSVCVFPFLLFFVWLVFVGTLNVCCFFWCAHRKRNSRNLVCPRNRILRKAWGGRKTHAESRFLPCLRSQCRPVLVFLFSVCAIFFSGCFLLNFFCAKLFLIFFWMHVLHFFLLESNIKCLTLKEKSAKRVFKNISGRVAQKSTIKTNQRRELHNQRIRKPELDANVISSTAKNDFLCLLFSPSPCFL